eukprot:TRINITY_DN50040_c0_g1_i1.p1 TRINITY_DN50040_c0_g1~~TRINITY_DN50040_c0_g1_i1.p1  ORF type:complete len:342 (+),score=34.56 TRINITY_DN50040_c0_g1_i1:71-1096(+)
MTHGLVRNLVRRSVVIFLSCGMFVDCNALAIMPEVGANRSVAPSTCIVHGKPRRIAWLHIPKTGSSFGNVIAHYLRPDLPRDAVVPNCRDEVCPHVDNPRDSNIEFQHRYNHSTWFRDCVWLKGGHGPDNLDWFSHHQLHEHFLPEWEGSLVGMFRDPGQRAISSWHSFGQVPFHGHGKLLSKEQWARRIEGTATKMLAGQEFPIEAHYYRLEESLEVPNVELALSRLDGFLFVGLVDHWALSVCLFHRITASACSRSDADNTRKNGNRGVDESWDTSELNGYVDPFDIQIYQAAKSRFWKDVEKHGLTTEVCHKTCPWFDPASFGFSMPFAPVTLYPGLA